MKMYSDEESLKKSGIVESGGVVYDVGFYVENNDMLTIHVTNRSSLEEWVGKYDVSYIEELSHKTGNFKQFDIFCSMLESSLLQNSDSVTLDILSYEDLKVLRKQKLGAAYKSKKGKENADNKLQTKRYLIMTYTVEFDQIHYPLPLIFTGSSDPVNMKKQIKKLKEEIEDLKKLEISRHKDLNEIEFNKLLKENKVLREELEECRQYLQEVGTGNFGKELKVLKKVVQNLETDLLKERNKHHHAITKKKKEFDKVIAELEDVKANERNYRIRCKSLADEIEMLKRDSRSGMIKNTSHHARGLNVNGRHRSRERNRLLPNSKDGFKRRSSERSGSASSIRRTPSPSGNKRFDPSAYVKEREKKRRESEINRSGRRTPTSTSKRDITPQSYKRFTKPPSGGSKNRYSAGRNSNRKNRSSSLGSDTDSITNLKMKKRNHSERDSYRRVNQYVRSDTSDDEYYRKKDPPRSRVKSAQKIIKENISPRIDLKKNKGEDDGLLGIAEIDARLEALQKFMHDNMN